MLPRLRPRAAARYFLTGEIFDAAEAVSDRAGDRARTTRWMPVLDGLRAASPQGLAASKPLATAAVLAGFDREAKEMAELSARLFASPEAAEGIRAFRERREPPWAL